MLTWDIQCFSTPCKRKIWYLTGTSQLKQNAKAHSYICGICRTAFLCTTNEKMLRDHVASKHEKSTFEVGAGRHSLRHIEAPFVPIARPHCVVEQSLANSAASVDAERPDYTRTHDKGKGLLSGGDTSSSQQVLHDAGPAYQRLYDACRCASRTLMQRHEDVSDTEPGQAQSSACWSVCSCHALRQLEAAWSRIAWAALSEQRKGWCSVCA